MYRAARLPIVAGALAMILLVVRIADAAEPLRLADPLPVRNLSPGAALYGLPRPLGDLPARFDVALLAEHANNFTAHLGDDSGAAFDGTTTVTSLTLRGALGSRFEWGLEVPYVYHGGGFSDSLIDGFHDLFGLPDSGRNEVPHDRIDYRVVYQGNARIIVDESTGDLGDVRASLGYRITDAPGRHGILRAMIKAPTGDVDRLSGSGGTDAAVWFEWLDERLLERVGIGVSAMAGLMLPGNGDVASGAQQDLVPCAHLGLHHALTDWLTLHGQLDGYGNIVDTGVREFAGAALQGTLGGTLRLAPRARLDLGLSEDLRSSSAPDVVFLMRLDVRL